MILLLTLLLQVEPPREVAELVRRLSSDAPEEREQAVRRLKEIGSPARPALEEALKRGDADLKARAHDLLGHLVRAERVGALHGSPDRRVNVELRDAPLTEAIRAILHPFGMTGASAEESLPAKKLSLTLKDVPFWEALEGLEKAAGARMNLDTGRLEPPGLSNVLRTGRGEVRITQSSWGSQSSGGGPNKDALTLNLWLPPGAWICSAQLSGIEMSAVDGKPIECRWVPGLTSVRRHGLPSAVGAGCLTVPRASLKGVKVVSLRSTLTLGIPKDIERMAMERLP